MADDRYRDWDNDNRFGRDRGDDFGRDYGAGRDYTYSSARDYAAAGSFGRDDRNFRGGGTGYGGREGFGNDRYGRADDGGRYGAGGGWQGSYGSDGHRFTETDRDRSNRFAGGRDTFDRGQTQRGYGRPPEGYRYQDRGFLDRAGDEVRSWFGDEDAEQRRRFDQRYDEQLGSSRHDGDYHGWRRQQIEALDRDYDEYRRENAQRFANEFGTFRTERQTQRSALAKVTEHMEVVGSDGQHVGTVDKVRGDRIILTKNDVDAGGRHHSIPSRWIETVADKVTIRKTAEEAKAHWRDEETNGALFGGKDDRDSGRVDLNRSFSGTY